MQVNCHHQANPTGRPSKARSFKPKHANHQHKPSQQDSSGILRQFLSPNHQKISELFNTTQKQIITHEFQKMLRKLKDKISVSQRTCRNKKNGISNKIGKSESNRSQKLETSKEDGKTKRKAYSRKLQDENVCIGDHGDHSTIHAIPNSNRKIVSRKQQKSKIMSRSHQFNQNITSPNKNDRHSKKCLHTKFEPSGKTRRNASLPESPDKQCKYLQKSRTGKEHDTYRTQLADSVKDTKQRVSRQWQNSYYLLADQFFQLDGKESQDLQNSIIKSINFDREMQKSGFLHKMQDFKATKKTVVNQVSDDQKQCFKDFYEDLYEDQDQSEVTGMRNCSHGPSTNQNDPCSPLEIQPRGLETVPKFYIDGLHSEGPNLQQSGTHGISPQQDQQVRMIPNSLQEIDSEGISNITSQQSVEFGNSDSPTTHSKDALAINLGEQGLINIRIDDINTEMRRKKQVLDRLKRNNEITCENYQKYLDILMQKYSLQIEEAEELKEMMQLNSVRVNSIRQKQESIDKWLQDAQKAGSGTRILHEMFQDTCSKQRLHSSDRHVAEQLLGAVPQFVLNQQLDPQIVYQRDEEQGSGAKQSIKKNSVLLINERIKQQMGIGPKCPDATDSGTELVNSSVGGIFHFLKEFSKFLLYYHKQDILKCINMPYGNSVPQRLRNMQGHEIINSLKEGSSDEEDGEDYVEGLEQIIAQEVYDSYYQCLRDSRKQGNQSGSAEDLEYEKIHNRAVFDGLNQLLNEYRPFYFVGGIPYPWQFSEKSLTFFYISEHNVSEILEKSRFEIMKMSSMLCGVHVPQLVTPGRTEPPQDLPAIFQKYAFETDHALLENREEKNLRVEILDIRKNNYQWSNLEQFKTTLLYELSSMVLEELAQELTGLKLIDQPDVSICYDSDQQSETTVFYLLQ